MADSTHRPVANPLHWFPEYLTLSRRRIRSQSRLLGSAVLVGIVAGTSLPDRSTLMPGTGPPGRRAKPS
jgi:hypothetical protein